MADYRDYFNTRLTQEMESNHEIGISTKYDDLQKASQEKVVLLREHAARQAIIEKAQEGTWASKAGFADDSLTYSAIDGAAHIASGTGRVAGYVASSIPNLIAGQTLLSRSDEQVQAYARFKQKIATPADLELLNSPTTSVSKYEGQVADGATPLQLFKREELARQSGKEITNFFDISNVADSTKQNNLNEAIGAGFDENWDQTKQGFKSALKGNVSGVGDTAAGVAKILFNAGEAVFSNAEGAGQYVLENIPQLAIGAVAKVGGAALALSNVGYAADAFTKGITEYQKQNNGALPSLEERQSMAVQAASLAAAEHVGDHLSLGFMKTAKDAAGDAVKTGFKKSLQNIGKSTASGFGTEALTEGYQSGIEASLDQREVTAKEVFTGAVIGGVSGGAMSGGGRSLAEVTKSTPEHIQEKVQANLDTDTFVDAVGSNDTAAYLDESKRNYNPAKAVAVLYGNSQKKDISPEDRSKNLDEANQIVTGLENNRDDLQSDLDRLSPNGNQKEIDRYTEQLDTATPDKVEGIKSIISMLEEDQASFDATKVDPREKQQLQDKITKIDRHLTESRRIKDQLALLVQPKAEDLAATIAQADAIPDSTKPEEVASTSAAVDRVITLAMAHPDSFTDEHLNQLVSNTGNSLTATQRDYLRSVSAARIAENRLKGIDGVKNEVLNGDPAKGQLGIKDYKYRIGEAIAGSNQKKADRNIEMLSSFAAAHRQKVDLFTKLFNKAKSDGSQAQVIPTKTGWIVSPTVMSAEELKAIGGLTIHKNSGEMVGAIHAETKALEQTKAQLQLAYSLKFTTTTVSPKIPPVSSTPSTEVQSIQGKPQSNVDSTVDNSVASTSVTNTEQGTALEDIPVSDEATIDRVLADLNAWEEVASLMEAAEEQAARDLAAELEGMSSQEVDEYLAELNNELSEENTNVESGNQERNGNEGNSAEVSLGTSQESDGNGETTSETEQGEGSVSGKLSLFNTAVDLAGKKFGEAFQKINLVAHQLVQKLGTGVDKRPLVAEANFLKNWIEGKTDITGYLPGIKLSKEQEAVLEDFKTRSAKWLPLIQASLVKGSWSKKEGKAKDDSDFYFSDPVQFLIEKLGNKADMEENVKTAIAVAAYTWIAENAGGSQLNTREAVKEMFGVKEHEEISDELFAAIRELGSMDKVVINSMGQRVTQALGFSENDNATQDFLPKLQSDLGVHVMKLLMEMNVIERNEVASSVIKDGLPSKLAEGTADSASATQGFLRVVRTKADELKDRKLNPVAEGITTLSKGTSGIVGKLFSVEAELIEPSWKPIKSKQTTTKNTDQGIPSLLKKWLGHEDASASFIRQDTWGLFNIMDKALFLSIAGSQDINPALMHKTTKDSAEASNDALEREYDRANEYFTMVGDKSPLRLLQPLFFAHTAWKQQRVGIATNMINPQTSKLHRFMLSRKDWDTKVSSTDLESFKLRVAEGLGVKTDKQENTSSITNFDTLFDPKSDDKKVVTLRKAVKALQVALKQEETLSADLQQAIVAGVKAGGEKMHSLDALIAMAHYKNAEQAAEGKDFTFTVQMMGEVDGVTNGPMLSHLLLGAASSPDQLYAMLNKGGFFRESDGFKNYNVWRSAPGHSDLYETTIGNVINRINNNFSPTEPKLLAMWAITGQLEKDDKITKDGRNIIKTPLTAMVFGSAVDGAINSMFQSFVLKTYEGFEKLAKVDPAEQDAARREYLTHINVLLKSGGGKEGMTNRSIEDLMSFEFSKGQLRALENVFQEILGEAVKETMQADFSVFMENRTQINSTAQATFALFDAAYQGIRNNYITELMESGDLAYAVGKDGRKIPRHDLTKAQEKVLEDRLKALNPVVHTYMSKESNELDSGLHISKSSRKISQDPAYRAQAKFGKPFPNGDVNFLTAAYQRALAAPGVAMIPMMMHSLDSAISHMAAFGTQVLNIHDAHGTGLQHFTRTAQRLNAATWTTTLNYSPAAEMRDAWVRTVMGMDALIQSSENTDEVVQTLKQTLQTLAKKKEPLGKVLQRISDDTSLTAYMADKVKYETMSQMHAIDQYALQGGQYDVTEDDRKEALKKLDALEGLTPQTVLDAIERINKAVLGAKSVTKMTVQPLEVDAVAPKPTSVWGVLGTSSIKSDAQLQKLFEANNTQTAAKIIAAIENKLSPQNRLLLKLVQKIVNPNLTVQYITKDTPEEGILGKEANARGWFSYKGTEESIYVLGTEFKASGLTPEMLLHELIHASLARVINKEAGSKENTPAKELIKELEALRQQAAAFTKGTPFEAKYAAALSDVHELVSWGMSDLGFQTDVLSKLTVESKTKRNVLVTGMQKFITTLSSLLFRKPNEQVNNGLSVLISNVSGLFMEANQSKTNGSDSHTSAMANNVNNLTTIGIYEALDTQAVSPSFDTHLRELLDGIVNKLHGPYGSLKALAEANQVLSPVDLWMKAMVTGVAPFASSIPASGFPMNKQVAFVLEQVEATVRASLDVSTGQSSIAYTQLSKLYTEVRSKLSKTGSEFNTGDAAQDQALYDFIFKMESSNGDKSDYMARFAALGLAHPDFNRVLAMATDRDTRSLAGMGFVDRLHTIFTRILSWFAGKNTQTFDGQQANDKLQALVGQLVHIEAKRKAELANKSPSFLEPLETKVKELAESGKQKVEVLAKSVANRSGNAFVQVAGNLTSAMAGNRMDYILNGFNELYDQQFRKGQGITAGVINEIRGANDTNLAFHSLLREAKRREGIREDAIVHTSNVVIESFANKGKDLSQEQKNAVTAVFLRTDMASLTDHFTLDQIKAILDDPKELNNAIAALEAQLVQFKQHQGFYIKQSKILGYKLATGAVKGKFLLMNAANIAQLIGTAQTKNVTATQASAAEVIIDQLVTMYALKYSKAEHMTAAREVMDIEHARGAESGIDMVLKLHKHLQAESKAKLFEGNEILMMKGYTPEMYNPHMEVLVATDIDGALLVKQGYSPGVRVGSDPADPDKTEKRFYTRDGGGLRSYLSGIISYTGENAKGSRSRSENVKDLQDWKANKDELRKMHGTKQREMTDLFKHDPSFDPAKVTPSYAAPVFNNKGQVSDYRYLMQEDNKNLLLERNNSFEKILGSFAGSIYDKESTKTSNRKAVQALYDQYQGEYAARAAFYIPVSMHSPVAEHRDIYRMLPEDTKQAIKEIWGNEGMMVRSDLMDINFGYRKVSLSDSFDKTPNERKFLETFFVDLMTHVMGEKAAYNIRRAEDIWQELVHETKDILVVKNVVTLMGNVGSNISLLYWYGVPMKDMLHHHRVALKGAMAYRKDSAALAELETKLASGFTQGNDAEIQFKITRLKDAIARNPVKQMIDDGLMPTIVEDVTPDNDMYSYKTRLVKSVDEHTSWINPNVKDIARKVYMAKDTKAYQALNHATQLSDFIARYTLYQFATTRKDNPLGREEAVQLASDAFINYDIPSHRDVQYLNDMGIIWFTKYYLRIQKVIAHLYMDNPGRALMLLSLNHFYANAPVLMDSGFMNKLGHNPFSKGALNYPGTLDELATVKLGMGLFH